MNYQDHCSPRRKSCCSACPAIIVGFFVLLLALAVGLILGAVGYETILPVLASVIAFAAAVAAITIGLALYYWCRRSE